MPESLLDRRLKLGTFLGIGLYVHWSFALVVGFVAISSRQSGPSGIAFAIAQLIGVFVCVTLHEYGHAMAARRFGIGTADITLLPIGGVARLLRMPRIPWQELIVAVAGPAVNVVIALLLLAGFLLLTDANVLRALGGYLVALVTGGPVDPALVDTIVAIFISPSWLGFAVFLLVVNIMLVVFNMIPAFPMDGGRVFRSLLAMIMDYRNATSIASRVGLLCAGLLAFFSLTFNPSNPFPVLIAAFVGYAGIAEARQVEVMESVRGLTAGRVMIRTNLALPMDMPLEEIARRWRSLSMPALPVLSVAGTVIGMLRLSEVAEARADGRDPATTAGQLLSQQLPTESLFAEDELESALMRTGKYRRQFPVIDREGYPIGILDLDSILARGQLPPFDLHLDRGQRLDTTS